MWHPDRFPGAVNWRQSAALDAPSGLACLLYTCSRDAVLCLPTRALFSKPLLFILAPNLGSGSTPLTTACCPLSRQLAYHGRRPLWHQPRLLLRARQLRRGHGRLGRREPGNVLPHLAVWCVADTAAAAAKRRVFSVALFSASFLAPISMTSSPFPTLKAARCTSSRARAWATFSAIATLTPSPTGAGALPRPPPCACSGHALIPGPSPRPPPNQHNQRDLPPQLHPPGRGVDGRVQGYFLRHPALGPQGAAQNK